MHALTISLFLAAAPGPSFIEDDYAGALAKAKAEQKLLFVDAWAPWCHTCVTMRESVFPTPEFAQFESALVFAAVDTEQPRNAAFLTKFPIEVLPTLFFIDPATERVVFKWLGSVDATQMQALISAARAPVTDLSKADQALGQNDFEGAARQYQSATTGSQNVDARTVLSMLSALSRAQQYETCARTALEQLEVLRSTQDRVSALTWAIDCALQSPLGDSRNETLASLVKLGRSALGEAGALPDDTSSLYEVLVDERTRAGDALGAQAVAEEWLHFVNQQARKAPTPAARAAFDAHRVSAAIATHQAGTMLEPLKQSEREFPLDYNPPARLALLYRELGDLNQASTAIERALRKCKQGPRKLRLFDIKLSILEARKDAKQAKRTLQEALRYARHLPPGQRSIRRVEQLEERLKNAR